MAMELELNQLSVQASGVVSWYHMRIPINKGGYETNTLRFKEANEQNSMGCNYPIILIQAEC